MKHRMLIVSLALTAVVIGSSAITVSAQDQPAGKPGHEGHHRPMMGLLPPPMVEKLSADQKTKYDAIVADFKTAAAPIHEKMKAAHEAGDKEAMKDLYKEVMPIHKAAMEKVEQILTDEQKAELKKMREEHAHDNGAGKGAHGKADATSAPQQ